MAKIIADWNRCHNGGKQWTWLWRDMFLNYKEDKRWGPRALCSGVEADGSSQLKPALKEYKAYGGKL